MAYQVAGIKKEKFNISKGNQFNFNSFGNCGLKKMYTDFFRFCRHFLKHRTFSNQKRSQWFILEE